MGFRKYLIILEPQNISILQFVQKGQYGLSGGGLQERIFES